MPDMSEQLERALLMVEQSQKFIRESRELIRRSRENSAQIARLRQADADQTEDRKREDDVQKREASPT